MSAYTLLDSKLCGFTQLNRAVVSEQDALQFFVDAKLIKITNSKCDCGAVRMKYKHVTSKLGFKWKCMNKFGCGKLSSPLKGTWFERSHLSFLKIFDLILHWNFRQKVRLTMTDCQVSTRTACGRLNLAREVCYATMTKKPPKIGGPGMFVEVDEAHLFKRKYNRGHSIKGESVWILGGICRETKERFAVRIKKKNRKEIWRNLKKQVAKGSILVTDGYIAYKGVDVALGFAAHEVVIHKKEFVNSMFREIFTNNVECMWGKLKKVVINNGNNASVDRYIAEYLYRALMDQKYGHWNYGSQIKHFLGDIKKIYPCQ